MVSGITVHLIIQVLNDVLEPGLRSSLSGLEGLLLVLGQRLRDASLLFKSVSSLLFISLIGLSLGLSHGFSVGVQFVHELLVLQGVLNLHFVSNEVFLGGSNNRLNFIGVDDSRDVSISQDGSFQLEVLLEFSSLSERTEHGVQSLNSGSGPDAESTQLSSRGEGLEVKSIHVGGFNTGDISESFDESDVFIGVNNQWSFLLLISFISDLSSSGLKGLGVNNLLDVFVSSESLQERDGLVSLFERFKSVFDNQGEFRDLGNLVSSGLDQGGKGGGGQSSGDGMSSLLEVHLSVPSSVVLEGEGHSSLSDHISEGGLASSGSSGSRNSGNSSNGSTGTPRFGGVSHTSFGVNTVGLSGVLRQVGVNELHDVQTDGGLEHGGHGNLGFSNLFRIVNVEDR